MRRKRVMRESITIKSATKQKDAPGQRIKTWTAIPALTNLPAHMEFIPGVEKFRDSRVQADVLAVFELRITDTPISTNHQLVHKGVAYGIESVRPIEGMYEGGFRWQRIMVKADANG